MDLPEQILSFLHKVTPESIHYGPPISPTAHNIRKFFLALTKLTQLTLWAYSLCPSTINVTSEYSGLKHRVERFSDSCGKCSISPNRVGEFVELLVFCKYWWLLLICSQGEKQILYNAFILVRKYMRFGNISNKRSKRFNTDI